MRNWLRAPLGSFLEFSAFVVILPVVGYLSWLISHWLGRAEWPPTWHFLTLIAELLVAWAIWHEVGASRHVARQEFVRKFFDIYATQEFAQDRRVLQEASFKDLATFKIEFGSGLRRADADRARRRIKWLLAWIGNLLDKGLVRPEEVFFVDLPYQLYTRDNPGRLLRVELELLTETDSWNCYDARADSVWYAELCAEQYEAYIEHRIVNRPSEPRDRWHEFRPKAGPAEPAYSDEEPHRPW